jgi:DMSO/TMAO reductase YedYZ molybdopterin-dependent catalytic subunit
LDSAGVKQDAKEVILVGADGGREREAGGITVDAYARSIPLAKAFDPSTLIVHRMNGEPLPAIHGGPLRVVVPGWYGMDSVKWLKQILVSSEEFRGFYQTERYYDGRRIGGRIEKRPLGPIRVKSQIARPIQGEVFGRGAVSISGAAWVGEGEITRVDVSSDGGRTWTEARLGPDRASHAWRLWSSQWTPAGPGVYEALARARDSRGNQQPLERDPAIVTPYANNWIDRRTIQIGS